MRDLTGQEIIEKIESGELELCDLEPAYRTDKICMAAVCKFGMNLKYVTNQTEELCLAAVKQNGWALMVVENQTEEICFAAVKSNSDALRYVKNQNEKIYKKALNKNILSFIYVDANIYKYKKHEILMAYACICNKINYKSSSYLTAHLNKTAEVLGKLSDDDLIKAINIDLKPLFVEENLRLSEGLSNLKGRVDMFDAAGDKIAVIDKKPKII